MNIWHRNAKIEKLCTEGRRIIAVSDIHANLPYFRGLLERVGFCEKDELIIVGDFLEKGAQSLETLRLIMELHSRGNVHVICGNCDGWSDVVDPEAFFDAERLLGYMLFKRSGLCWDMLTELGVEITEQLDLAPLIPVLAEKYAAEFSFLDTLPQIVDTPHYTFVHGGIRPDEPLEEQKSGACMKFDDFMSKGFSFDKWVIVGHWPVMLYLPDRVCANPIIDREHRIISIDGGCTLKDDGQLNALIIPCEGSEDFGFDAYDPFPVRRVLTPQKRGEGSYYIRWGDNRVRVLSRGKEFSLCRHLRTGYEMKILTKYLYSSEEETECNDCTDLVLGLEAGDEVSVVEETSEGYLVKHRGTSGWYFGELE